MANVEALQWLNSVNVSEAEAAFLRCCGSRQFASQLASRRPFANSAALVETSRNIWWNEVNLFGWLEAFEAHPRIGDVEGLRKKFASTASWCEGEQAAALNSGDTRVLEDLAEWNKRYEARFGHIFIICASGRSSREVLASLQARYPNSTLDELRAAAREQQKITELRLEKLLSSAPPAGKGEEPAVKQAVAAPFKPWHSLSQPSGPSPAPRPPITTHVLDTALGRPAAGIAVLLEAFTPPTERSVAGAEWQLIGTSETDSDGRSGALMPASPYLAPGTYRLTFHLSDYFARNGLERFYPHVEVVFEVLPEHTSEHFHVPLLLSPFSYSTYRGS